MKGQLVSWIVVLLLIFLIVMGMSERYGWNLSHTVEDVGKNISAWLDDYEGPLYKSSGDSEIPLNDTMNNTINDTGGERQ